MISRTWCLIKELLIAVKIIFLVTIGIIQGKAQSLHPMVSTELEVTLVQGKTGTIPCKYDSSVNTVTWKKGLSPPSSTRLITLDLVSNVGAKLGEKYDAGAVDIEDDYSLIIVDVSGKDEGRYFCEVSDLKTGALYRNHTDVTVIGE